MRSKILKGPRLWMAYGLMAMCLLGCSKAGYQDYIPGEDTAREALTTALDSWKNGNRIGAIDNSSMHIDVVDSNWQAGQKLYSYEITGAESGNGPDRFSVRMVFGNQKKEQEVRYVVLGKQPRLWVYREQDYNHAAGM
jgi:hypothetical protein